MKWISRRQTLMIARLVLFALAVSTVHGQANSTDRGVQFAVSGPSEVCSNGVATFRATVKNVGEKPIRVHKDLWRYLTEKALDRTFGTVSNSALLLKAPMMRGTIAESIGPDEEVVSLAPAEDLSAQRKLDLKAEVFYREPGRYSIRLLLPLENGQEHKDGDIFSPEFVFIVVNCKCRAFADWSESLTAEPELIINTQEAEEL